MKRTRMLAAAGVSLGLAVALQSGCAQSAAVVKPQETAQPETAQAEKAPGKIETLVLTGKVVESMKAGAYSFVALEKDGKVSWAAMSSPTLPKVGEELTLSPGMVMKNFTSKALNRTFESIVFTDGLASQPPAPRHNQVAVAPAAAPAQPEAKIAGKVVETMDGGGYTYLNVESDGKSSWVAIPAAKVAVGQQVELLPGMTMEKFASKSLNKTFDRIVFSSGLAGAPAASAHATGALPPGHPPMDGAKPAQQPEEAAAVGALPPGHPPMNGAKPAQQPEPAAAAAGEAKAAPKAKKMGGMMGMMAQSGQEGVALAGKVVEAVDAAGYTYLLVEQEGKKAWAAVPTTKVSVGQELKLLPGTEMKNFTSKTLNKTFDSVIFSSGVAQ